MPAFEDIDRLEARVVAALDAEIGAPGGPAAPIDRRLKLAKCPTPVEIDPPALGAVALRCPMIGWRIRVPQMRGDGGGGAMAMQAQARPERAVALIKRGDPVELRADGRAFSVVGEGVADEDGAAGARIRVKFDRSRPPVVGQVVDVGVVRIAAR
jgi:flagella basal body P-ring formation protein FlgA